MPPATPASSTRRAPSCASWSTVTDPRLGETVLDPACGTGGFLVEAFNHLAKQVQDRRRPHRSCRSRSLFGGEAKPLPYLLCQMNLLLHGLDAPQIDPGNALRFKLTEIGERDRVDVILTNPPFGGEEEKGIQGNFPEDKQTAETALLFLQLIMRKLRRRPTPAGRPARAAVVVPNGTLFGDGVCARIKEELLKEFNLHTIVRLPNGVFAPYTSIPTNLLFFDRSGPTKEVWYYEQPLPEGRKNYTKTQPLQFEEFARVHRLVGEARGERPGLEGPGGRAPQVQRRRASRLGEPRPQEPERQGGHRAPAAGATGGEHPGEGTAHRRDRRTDQSPSGETVMKRNITKPSMVQEAPPGYNESAIVIYQSAEGIQLDVKLEKETLWLTQKQMAVLFDTERSVITKHLNNIFASGELNRESNVQKMHIAGSDKPVAFHALDAIISVGYRVNSKRGTQFRVWATSVLRDHILKGFSVNERRLKELNQAIRLIADVAGRRELSGDEAKALLSVVADYSFALDLLDDYDHQRVAVPVRKPGVVVPLDYSEARRIVDRLRDKFGSSALFGIEKDNGLKGALGAVMQTFGGKDLYPTLEEKAAHLLYFLVKDHAFVDGNKRIGASLFLWFLEKNGALYRPDGSKRIADATLVAVTLLIAESKPAEKDLLTRVLVNLIGRREP